DARKLVLERVPFGLRSCLAASLKALAHHAHTKDLELLLDIPSSVPDRIIGDPQRLRQIVVNLVGNAVKFTERGEILVSVSATGAPRANLLTVRVSDTGIGIPVDKRSMVFDAFSQADEATTRRYGGTGLGLAICHQLVAMLGGTIELESEVGRGST